MYTFSTESIKLCLSSCVRPIEIVLCICKKLFSEKIQHLRIDKYSVYHVTPVPKPRIFTCFSQVMKKCNVHT